MRPRREFDRQARCPETRGTLTCNLKAMHGDMHEDPTRGKWRHPKLPHGIKKVRHK